MNIGHSTAPTRCPRCLRTRQEAIAEHVRLQEGCDCPGCPFRDDILNAIEQDRKPRFSFGPARKPAFTFSKHSEETVKAIFRKINDDLNRLI